MREEELFLFGGADDAIAQGLGIASGWTIAREVDELFENGL